jgi:hypothetical protein
MQLPRLGTRKSLVIPFAIDARAFEELIAIVELYILAYLRV